MHPVLLTLHAFGRALPVHSYGVALAVGFAIAVLMARRHALRIGEEPRVVGDVWLGLIVSSLLGARLLFVVTNPARFVPLCRDELASGSAARAFIGCTTALRLWEGGDLVFYGGAIGGLVFLAWHARRHTVRFARLIDLLIPSAALGHAFGRVGCFLAGCCYGRPSDLWWAARFGRDSLAFQQLVARGRLLPQEPTTPALHPVQLYEAAGELTLFFLLARLLTRRRYDGQLFVAWLAGYGLLRFVLEGFRGDDERGFLMAGLSTSQSLALVAVALAITVELWSRRRHPAVAL